MEGAQPTRDLRRVLKSTGLRAGASLAWEALVIGIMDGARKQLTHAWPVKEGFLIREEPKLSFDTCIKFSQSENRALQAKEQSVTGP